MDLVRTLAQIVIALGIFNVWVVRFGRPTRYRGGTAGNMREEFAAYGLPVGFMWLIGGLKIALAIALIVGIWVPALVTPAAVAMAVLMAGAIAMHVKVRDPARKAVPAGLMLALSLVVVAAGARPGHRGDAGHRISGSASRSERESGSFSGEERTRLELFLGGVAENAELLQVTLTHVDR